MVSNLVMMDLLKEKARDFLIELDNIDFQFIIFFLSRDPIEPEDIRDRLKNHYKFEVECGKAYFTFLKGSNLPLTIRKKCIQKFVNLFEDGVFVN